MLYSVSRKSSNNLEALKPFSFRYSATKTQSSERSLSNYYREPVYRKCFAFTLIELLIVVAIIGILAAIALPNFLEAQIRAKVSRVHNDIRVLTTAVESYRVDTNKYPPHEDKPSDLVVVTTPIGYITALPEDPFVRKDSQVYHMVGDTYTWQDLHNIYYFHNPGWGGGAWLRDAVNGSTRWSLSSPGPDLYETMSSDASASYDPTNGTMSVGDVYRLGP